MKSSKIISAILIAFFLCFTSSCSEDNTPIDQEQEQEEQIEEIEEETEETEEEEEEEEEEENDDDDDDDDDDDEETSDSFGTITLSGDETSDVGTTLVVGHLKAGLTQLTGNERTVIITDENTPISEEEGPEPNDVGNNFIIVGLDLGDKATQDAERGLSINISVDGTDYKYACAIPIVSGFINCGEDFHIDFEKKEIIFSETKVINTKTESVLTMDGTITWE
ncbi:hypothetical protein [Zobellia roscoffensis]|uniref:hypothetical protein n=2 Tax=Zobellia roscoffensis TaxID=2779508 RepID=UPI00188A577C|nr:hypothetical protein [Zobellia roscoffensis]